MLFWRKAKFKYLFYIPLHCRIVNYETLTKYTLSSLLSQPFLHYPQETSKIFSDKKFSGLAVSISFDQSEIHLGGQHAPSQILKTTRAHAESTDFKYLRGVKV
jgi:hypothetical protein